MADEELKKRRAEVLRKRGEETAATTDSAFPPANDVNPTHREDFNSLVNAAAQKREREG